MRIPIIVDNVYAQLIDKRHAKFIYPHVAYRAKEWKNTQRGRYPIFKDRYLIDSSHRFYCGLIPYLESNGLQFKYVGMSLRDLKLIPDRKPTVPDVAFFKHQDRIIDTAIAKQRGLFESPTASGKTMIAMAIMSAFDVRWLFVVERRDLLYQTVEELQKNGFTHVGTITEGQANPDVITVALINTLEKFCYTKLAKQFDAVICDECHHVAEETRYERAFKEITAPFKIGLTGTLPPDDKRMLTMIGLFGPVLDKIEYEELQDAGILADPTIYLHEALHTEDLPHIDDWKRAYSRGIVHNAFRNKQITLIVEDFIKRGLTGLVMIREIKHGKNLVEMFKEHQIKNFKFVYGGTEQDERNAVRKALANKEHDVVICSIIWNEGINIPSLGAIVKADGGSSEIKTIQAAGRGLRTTEEKTELEFHDFMDRGNRYLAAHSLDRIATYLEKKWRIVYGGK